MKKYDVVIIGAGTAGLSARKEIAKVTDNYLVIDKGPLGTTCARVGCMPSKVLLQAAKDYGNLSKMKTFGVHNTHDNNINYQELMTYVQNFRDHFVEGVIESFKDWESNFLCGEATFIDSNTIRVDKREIKAEKFIIAVGSRPKVPEEWEECSENLLTTDEIFELENLPAKIGIIGLGPIGIEIGQAFSLLGIEVKGYSLTDNIGNFQSKKIKDTAFEYFSNEFPIKVGKPVLEKNKDKTHVSIGSESDTFDKVLVCIGRKSNIDKINLQNIVKKEKIESDKLINESTLQMIDHPHIFIVGDSNEMKSVLHESSLEGKFVGRTALGNTDKIERKTPLSIIFSEPEIAFVGKRSEELKEQGISFKTGAVSFEDQGRSKVMGKNHGIAEVYVDSNTGLILGSELFCPDAEYLSHLLAWSIEMETSRDKLLTLPFYHPTVLEGLRTALINAK